ncbi:putative ribonuclease H-like domain-containing protein [Tanacetum coccineum]|uniref:Ribonuclease H-like domain-containing protein n=1 Tax=Tanacetum coccineum TaxID=301880 RepID=A0ABQ4WWJ2_9ASTR
MEAETTSTTLTARLPILNPREYDLWLMRIEQYFLMTDDSLWEVILNGNKVLKRTVGEVEQIYEPTSAEEKLDRKNEMKAIGTLLMALPNKDQLKFHSYKDAKLLMEAIEKRYEGNKESKKVQRTLLKQQYENFAGSSSEIIDQTFDRLQKLISRLEIQGSTSTSQNLQNMAFVSSNCTNNTSSTNEADTTAYGVSAAHTQCNLVNSTSVDNLSDAVICAFLASQPNSPQLAREDLKQIDPGDLEEMDLQWEMDMLTIRARRFIKTTCRKLDINGQSIRFDRSKVECYNCHKNGHFARECRAPRNQENRGREIGRRTITVETPTKNALIVQDGIGGYDWSYQSEEEHPTNYALMAYTFSRSSSSSDSEVDSCSKTCVKAYTTLKEQYNSLSSDYKKSQFNLVSYKAVKLRDNALVENKKKLEKAEKERDELKLTLEKFQNSSKSLNNLLENQMLKYQENNKSKSDKGYHAVPQSYTGNFMPPKPDLIFIDEIVESEYVDVITDVTPSDVKTVESNHKSADVKNKGVYNIVKPKTVRKNSFKPPIIEDLNFDDESEVEFIPNIRDKTVRPSTEKIKFVKSARETVEKVERPKQYKHYLRGNQRNWNNLMSQRLGSNFKMINKACFVYGSFEHLHYECDKKVIRPVWNNSGKLKTAGAAVNTVRPVNTADTKLIVNHPRLISNAFKRGYSQVTRPFNKYSTNKNSIFNKKANTVRVKDTTARDRGVGNPTAKEYKKGKQHKASCKAKLVNSISKPLHMLHMDLSGPTNVKSLIKKSYCLVVTDDFSRFSWVFFLVTKDETSGILKTFIIEIENQLDYKVKVIRCDNGTELKNNVMNQFCEMKGIKKEFSVARTPQQNGVAERKNRTLIEAARTMLVDSKLPTTFWAEAVNTACYVLNRVLVIKPHTKTPYELIRGRTPLINFMKPFGYHVTILNTKDHLGKFDGKANDGFFVGYSVVSKAMRVFNTRTRIVEETLNIRFLENAPNVTGNGPDWLFDVDSLTKSMNYVPVVAGNQITGIARTRDNIVASQAEKKKEPEQEYILIPFCTSDPLISQSPKDSEDDAGMKPIEVDESGASDKSGKDEQAIRSEFERLLQQEKHIEHINMTNSFNTVSTPVNAAGPSFTDNAPSSPVNAARTSVSTTNAFEEHLFE